VFGQLDLEGVEPLRPGSRQGSLGGLPVGGLIRPRLHERLLSLESPPRFRRHAAEREACRGNLAGLDLQGGGHRGQGKLERRPVADLEIVRPGKEGHVRHLDHRYQLAVPQHRLARRVLVVGDVEVGDRDLPLALWPLEVDDGVKGGWSHAHVRRVGDEALLAGAQDRVATIIAVDCQTAPARLALVARQGGVAEIATAGALHEVAVNRVRVPDLRRGA
jgi:hypothetical protein